MLPNKIFVAGFLFMSIKLISNVFLGFQNN